MMKTVEMSVRVRALRTDKMPGFRELRRQNPYSVRWITSGYMRADGVRVFPPVAMSGTALKQVKCQGSAHWWEQVRCQCSAHWGDQVRRCVMPGEMSGTALMRTGVIPGFPALRPVSTSEFRVLWGVPVLHTETRWDNTLGSVYSKKKTSDFPPSTLKSHVC